ncbi:MAG: Uma2 family endonuclease, partial [Chloroflexota bacterium]
MVDLPQTGTRMTAAEYSRIPETLESIQLIDGVVFRPSSPKDTHQSPLLKIVFLLDEFQRGRIHAGVDNLYLSQNIVVQPDIMLVRPNNPDCTLGEDGYWHGAPDLVVEVLSPGTASLDRGRKFQLYAQHGVREYWLVDPQAQFIEVFTPQNSQFIQQGLYTIDATLTS